MSAEQRRAPRVGVGVILVRQGQVLLGRRRGRDGAGTWGLPGGYLEMFESWEECARRELREEAALDLADPTLVTTTNDVRREEQEHSVTIFLEASHVAGEPRVRAPREIDRWDWFTWNDLPEPRFHTFRNLIATGYSPRR